MPGRQLSQPNSDDADPEAGLTGRNGETESTTRSSNRTSMVFECSFHGSCSKCHHLHTNKVLRLSLDRAKHVRMQCEKCEHQMFGIGRTSTQTTLASVESDSSTSRSLQRPICGTSLADDLQSAHPVAPETLAPSTPLSIIDEVNTSAGRSRSTSNSQEPNTPSARPEGIAVVGLVEGHGNPIVGQHRLIGSTEITQPPRGRRSSFQKVIDALHRAFQSKKNSLKERKERRLFGITFRVRSIPTRQTQHVAGSPYHRDATGGSVQPLDPAHQMTTHAAEAALSPSLARVSPDLVSSPEDMNQESTVRGLDSTVRNVDSSVSEVDPSGREPGIGVDASRSEEPDDTSSPSTNAGHHTTELETKRNRILARRKEKTLQSKVAARPLCHCDASCECHGANREWGSDHTSETHGTIASDFEPPEHHLGPVLASNSSDSSQSLRTPNMLIFAGMGGHSRHATASARLLNRLSQATTIGSSSNGSSISLPGGRPGSEPWRAFARPGPQEAIHQYDRLHGDPALLSGRNHPTDPQFSRYDDGDGMTDVASASSSTSRPATMSSGRVGSPSTAEGRSPSLYVQTTNLLPANGTLVSESNEATPRPRSHNEPHEGLLTLYQLELDAITPALNDLSSTSDEV